MTGYRNRRSEFGKLPANGQCFSCELFLVDISRNLRIPSLHLPRSSVRISILFSGYWLPQHRSGFEANGIYLEVAYLLRFRGAPRGRRHRSRILCRISIHEHALRQDRFDIAYVVQLLDDEPLVVIAIRCSRCPRNFHHQSIRPVWVSRRWLGSYVHYECNGVHFEHLLGMPILDTAETRPELRRANR